MSASASKKRRKEELLTKKAAPEKNEKKSSTLKKAIIGIVAAVVAIALIIGIGILIKAEQHKADYDVSQPAMKVGDYNVSVPMFNIFYTFQLNNDNNYMQASMYGTQGAPLSELFGSDYVSNMIAQTKETVTDKVSLYLEAKNANYELTEEDQQAIEDSVDSLKQVAGGSPFGLGYDWFCADYFGKGCTVEDYRQYVELMQYCKGYEQQREEDFTPTADEVDAEYAANPNDYDTVSYTIFTVSAVSDGKDSTGTETYSEESIAEAEVKANEAAASFPETGTTAMGKLFSSASTTYGQDAADWLFSADRAQGDISVFSSPNKVHYYVLRFEERDDNDYCRANAYVTKFRFDTEGVELEEGQLSAADTFQKLCDGVKDGMSEEEFNSLVTSCGLQPSASAVDRHTNAKAVTDFLFDSARKDGDVFTYADEDAGFYYVVRFNAFAEDTYRNTLVKSKLHEAAETAWLEEIHDRYPAEVFDDAMIHAYTDRMA